LAGKFAELAICLIVSGQTEYYMNLSQEGAIAVNLNLHALSLKELKDLQSQVTRAIVSFEDRRKKEVMAALDEKARDMGFSLSELLGTAPTRKRTPAVPKYANPANKSETWSGRGRKPRWFDAALKSGKSPDSMSI
jgi:DNA-binding protein H-NS